MRYSETPTGDANTTPMATRWKTLRRQEIRGVGGGEDSRGGGLGVDPTTETPRNGWEKQTNNFVLIVGTRKQTALADEWDNKAKKRDWYAINRLIMPPALSLSSSGCTSHRCFLAFVGCVPLHRWHNPHIFSHSSSIAVKCSEVQCSALHLLRGLAVFISSNPRQTAQNYVRGAPLHHHCGLP